MRYPSRAVVSPVVAVLLGLSASLASAPAASAATHPTVVAGRHDANVPIQLGAYSDVASLALPAGRWFVTAKAVVVTTTGAAGTYLVNCVLVAGADLDYVSLAPLPAGEQGSRLPVLLTVVHRFAAPGQAKLRCGANVAAATAIGLIAINAIKVGKLTNGPIGGAGTTTGTGSVRVISAYRDATVTTPDGQWSMEQELTLPEGRWWIAAKALVSGSTTNIASSVHCALLAEQNDTVFAADTGHTIVAPLGFAGHRMVMSLQMVTRFGTSGGTADFRCSSMWNSFSTSWLKITAVKLGKVTAQTLGGGSSTTTGAGTPRVIFGTLEPSGPVSLTSEYKTVTHLPLPAGKWLVSAKSWIAVEGASNPVQVDCRIVFGDDRDTSRLVQGTIFSHGMVYLQVVHVSSADSNARLRCKRTGSGWSFQFNQIRMTAMKIGSLTAKDI